VSTCYVGSECKVIIGVNSASDKINGVDLVGTYDSTLLKLTSITQSDPFALKDINGKCLVPTGKTGTFKATCFANDLKKSIQANGKLVDVTFIPQKTGSSKLNFSCVNGNTSDSNITTSDTETDIISCKDNNEALINILTCKSGDRRCVDNGMRCVVAPCYSLDTQICVNGNWKKDGTCANSCTQDGYCDQKPISTPTPIPICGLIATPNTLSLKIGERATVKLSNDYSVKNCALPTALGINTWSSSNEKVATVEGETGVITGVSAGTATIKVLAGFSWV
jgi:hypothetical protein